MPVYRVGTNDRNPIAVAPAAVGGSVVTLNADGNWTVTQEGGSTANAGGAVRQGAGFTLTEGDSLRVAVAETITIPANPDTLTFSYGPLLFDHSDSGFMNDAFEVSIVDATDRDQGASEHTRRDHLAVPVPHAGEEPVGSFAVGDGFVGASGPQP